MSSGDTNRKTRPEIKVAINELVERHVAYYQGWLSSRARKQTSLPLTQQIPQHDDATPHKTPSIELRTNLFKIDIRPSVCIGL
jgi:hypothetical protein